MAVCVLLLYTIPNSFLYVSQEDHSLVESGQQIFDFYKWVILKQQKQCTHFYILLFPSVHLSVCCTQYLRNLTSSDHNFWNTCVKGWYLLGVFFIFSKFWFFGLLGGSRAKNGPTWQKLCLSSPISEKPYLIWSSFVAHMCKRIISPGFIFTFFPNFNFRGQYGKKRPKMAKNGVCCTSYLRKHTSYECDFCYTFVKWWYLQQFFHFFKILFF